MEYKLNLIDRSNTVHLYYYNAHTSQLLDQCRNPVISSKTQKQYVDSKPISKINPGKKIRSIKTLKVQLGLKCNYSCVYCSQGSQIDGATNTNNDDANAFIKNLDSWIQGQPEQIEYWGGEPFVYWSKLKILIPKLSEKFPNTRHLIITNGSLLDQEKIEFIEKYDINVGISHDGPQQKYRGPDPLNNPKTKENIDKLYKLRPNKMSFNIVMHSKNYNLNDVYEWFNSRYPNVTISVGDIINIYDNYSLTNIGQFTKKQYEEMMENVFQELIRPKPRFHNLDQKMRGFIFSLQTNRPISALYQKCGMDMEDNISVDLSGTVTTCQNTGAKDHKIGSVHNFDEIRLNTSTHLSYREECTHCPLVQICRGSCMFLDGDLFAQSCWNEYYFALGLFKAAIFLITDKILVSIDGDIRRPEYTQGHINKFPSLSEYYK